MVFKIDIKKMFFWLLPLIFLPWAYLFDVIDKLLFLWYYQCPAVTGDFLPAWFRMGFLSLAIRIIGLIFEYIFLLLLYKAGKNVKIIITVVAAILLFTLFFSYTMSKEEHSFALRILGCALILLRDGPFFCIAYYLSRRIDESSKVE